MDQIVKDIYGNQYHLLSKLGAGGQGAVFTVEDNDSIVIKAEVNDDDEIVQDDKKYNYYRQKINSIIALGEFDNIAIPYAILEKPYCGYVMIFMSGLQPISSLMRPFVYKTIIEHEVDNSSSNEKNNESKIEQICTSKIPKSRLTTINPNSKEEFIFAYNNGATIIKRIKILAKLAKILASFEDKNVVYCDISDNNVFVSKSNQDYETWLIDLDNLAFGSEIKNPIGTPHFMAPEVFKGNPNTIYSDRYSFAILAYQFLFIKEPFLGKAADDFDDWDVSDDDDDGFDVAVSNGEVAWIWEKDDMSNRSASSVNPLNFINETIYDLFDKTLNKDGRQNPSHRPSMWKWYEALVLASESSFERELKFCEPSFTKLIKSSRNTKYFYLKTQFMTQTEPFQEEIKVDRLKVKIKNVIEEKDDEGNVNFIAEDDKVIYWDASNDIRKYCLSNFDVAYRTPTQYDREYITFTRLQKYFAESTEFSITYPIDDYEVIVIEDNCRVTKINNLLNVVIYIKYNNKIIKKITIEKE